MLQIAIIEILAVVLTLWIQGWVHTGCGEQAQTINAFTLAFGPGGTKFGFRQDEKDLKPISFADLYNGPGSINGHQVRQLQI